MNKGFLALIFLFLLMACGAQKDKEALRIIKQSIETHGGWERWENLQTLSFDKDTEMYDETGTLESKRLQFHEFRINPIFQGEILWEVDSLANRIFYDGNVIRYWLGGNEIKNPSFLQSKQKELDAAFYAVALPFKLMDEGIILRYLGREQLEDGREADVVQVTFAASDTAQKDVWWHYFEPETYRLLAYKVKTSDHYSMVYNLTWDNSTGFDFPSERESYRVDSLGTKLYLRAKYSYTDYQAN